MIFTSRCYACAVLAVGLCLSICLCLSVTSRCSTKTTKCRITETTPHDSPGTPKISAKFDLVNPCRFAKCRWGGLKSATCDNNRLYLDKKLSYRRPQTSCGYHLYTDNLLWQNFLSPQCRHCSRDPDHAHLGSTHSSQD